MAATSTTSSSLTVRLLRPHRHVRQQAGAFYLTADGEFEAADGKMNCASGRRKVSGNRRALR